jgi:UDP-glucose 4-epimerase
MRLVLLGGNGFIGKHLAYLFQSFAEVVVVGRNLQKKEAWLDDVTYIEGDCADSELLRHVIKPDDHVVLLAYNSVPKTSFDNPICDIQENLPIAINLLKVLSNVKVRRLLYVSSGGTVYGNVNDNFLISESNQTNPISPYGITKLAIEKYCGMYSQLFNIPVVIARPANAFGPGQLPYRGQGFVATAAAMMMRGEPLTVFGQSGTIRDYIYIDDLCLALKILMTSNIKNGSIFNIGSENGKNNIEVIKHIAEVAGIPKSDIRISFLPARSFDVPYNILCTARLRALGWKINTNFNAGLEKTLPWITNYLCKRV